MRAIIPVGAVTQGEVRVRTKRPTLSRFTLEVTGDRDAGMILQIAAHARSIGDDGNSQAGKQSGGTNAGALNNRRRVQGTGSKNNAPAIMTLHPPAAACSDANGARPVQVETLDSGVAHNM